MRQEGITHSHELEMDILGIIILEGAHTYAKVYKGLKRAYFDHEANAIIFDIVKTKFDKGQDIDPILVVLDLQKSQTFKNYSTDNESFYVWDKLCKRVVSSAHLESWVMKLHEFWIERETEKLRSGQINGDALAKISHMKTSIDELLMLSHSDEWKDVAEVANSLTNRMEEIAKNKGNVFMKTGIRLIDGLNGGFKAGQFIILAARPGVGKSALSGNIIINIAKTGKRVGVINLEMDNEDVLSRMLSAESDVENYKYEQALIRDELENQKMINTLSKLATYHIKFSDETKVNINDIRAKALKLKMKEGLDFLVLDYIQLVNGASKNVNREQQVAEMSRGLKLLSRELKCPILALAQLNRTSTGEPSIASLRESGSLEQDADGVILLERNFEQINVQDVMVSEAIAHIAKWRNGSTGKQEMYFEGSKMRFTNKEDFNTMKDHQQPFTPDSSKVTRTGEVPNLIPLAEANAQFSGEDEELPF